MTTNINIKDLPQVAPIGWLFKDCYVVNPIEFNFPYETGFIQSGLYCGSCKSFLGRSMRSALEVYLCKDCKDKVSEEEIREMINEKAKKWTFPPDYKFLNVIGEKINGKRRDR